MILIMMENNDFIDISTADDDEDPYTQLFQQTLYQNLTKSDTVI